MLAGLLFSPAADSGGGEVVPVEGETRPRRLPRERHLLHSAGHSPNRIPAGLHRLEARTSRLFAVEATRRWAKDGIVANAVMPGAIMTNLQRHLPKEVTDSWIEAEKAGTGAVAMKTPAQGAATTLVAAVAPEFANVGGRYLEDCNEAHTVANNAPADDHRGVREWALDTAAATRLWDTSLAMLDTPVVGRA
ncbi:SDR family NAD(P)-dependent oxidoreductase [Streptomyces milbemycinicus]|uniref:Uncharacterized protein n=1 Tax=Streptomyces milbemycinicus TaxID=476552 RepID=A0ABW8M3C5_9ACTN